MPTKPAYGTPLNTASSLYSGLVCRYLLNDGSGTTPDDSGPNALHLTAINSPTWVTGSDGGMALSFGASGNQVLRLPAGIHPHVSGQMSLLFRVNPSTITPSPGGMLFWDWAGGSTNLYVELNNSKVRLAMGNGANGLATYSSTGNLHSAGTIQSILVMRSGTGLDIYLNGSLVGSTSTPNLGGLTANTVSLGGTPGPDSGYGYRGIFEHVAIWSRLLTSAEIAELSADPYAGYVSGAPSISSVIPDSGTPGTLVEISGMYLDTLTNLTLNGGPIIHRVDSGNHITAVIDENATSGNFQVENALGTDTSAVFTVTSGEVTVRPTGGWQWPLTE